MNSLVELLMHGGGLEGASQKQIRAVLEKLGTIAVVVPHASLPQAHFGVNDGEPYLILLSADGGPNTSVPFAREHLSAGRSMRAVKESMSVHAAITSEVPIHQDSYGKAREQFLRNRIEADSIAAGGAPALAEGAL
ncbi:hypothetical protein SAMN04489743_2823 [Pseudarthrobacter equi]|uniref:Uncharacterized protein n=1 Tax=Pseudarthrobacter equi TaxID=728066 RepID=A0A1H2A780_9MICC|nr:hypothetical protein [Pseudarthrobacter equi]SDT41744.1 hypothetical protein SAMN04489743_2823 [Pseudarthrobacter equi]